MSTVQLAIRNQRYAAALADLLHRDGEHEVVFVDRPDLGVDGIMVVDGNRAENLLLFEQQPQRFVVIARKDAELLSRVWDAGVRHVVFEEDSPATALLAVIAAELRAPRPPHGNALPARSSGPVHKKFLPCFPVPILDRPAARFNCCFSKGRKPLL
jgi:hypothetical protein